MTDGRGGHQRDWSDRQWAWDPALGPWRPDHGAPTGTFRLQISTDAVAPRQSYDFWRNMVFYNFSANSPDDEQRHHFRAQGTAYFTPEVTVAVSQADRLRGSRHLAQHRADGMDDISIGLVVEGSRWQVDASGHEHRARAGEFYVYDAARPAEVGWSRGGSVFVSMPRAAALASGIAGLTANTLARRLAGSTLAPFLAAQFSQLWKRNATLASADVARLTPSLLALARAALGGDEARDDEPLDSGRFAAACRFIHDHLGDDDLSPARIAAAIGCSRATLYRLFAERELPIAGYVRELRLKGAMTVLASRPGTSISAVAVHFGFNDLSTFSQAFRRRFGISPRDAGR